MSIPSWVFRIISWVSSAFGLAIPKAARKQFGGLVRQLYTLFVANDCFFGGDKSSYFNCG